MRLPPFLSYALRRIAISLVVLVGVSAIAFSMAYLLPSDPVTSRYPDITNEQRAEMRRQMGLDQPLVVQYARYMESVFRGDFGRSFGTGNAVGQDLALRIPATLELASFGILFGLAVGLPIGIVAAVQRGRMPDHIVRVANLVAQSIPGFWLGVVLIFTLYFQLRLVPAPIGRLSPMLTAPPGVTGFFTIDAMLSGRWEVAWAALRQLMLPAFVLGLGVVSPIARITRSAMSEALGEDYIDLRAGAGPALAPAGAGRCVPRGAGADRDHARLHRRQCAGGCGHRRDRVRLARTGALCRHRHHHQRHGTGLHLHPADRLERGHQQPAGRPVLCADRSPDPP